MISPSSSRIGSTNHRSEVVPILVLMDVVKIFGVFVRFRRSLVSDNSARDFFVRRE